MGKEKVYLDSTIPSYHVSKPSRDKVILIHQELTKLWWENERENYELYISEVVIEEILNGDPVYAHKRRKLLEDVNLLDPLPEIEKTALRYMEYFNFPEKLFRDMYHIAFSVHYKMDCLLTWNFTHLANLHMRKQLARFNERQGLLTPEICTPEELMQDKGDEIW
jgi:hypothetical protein